MATLTKLGFVTRELLLTPLQFGVPNSRLRYYLLAAARPRPSDSFEPFEPLIDPARILRHIPGRGADWSDARSSAATERSENDARPLRDYLDVKTKGCVQISHAVPERVLTKWGRLFDIVLPSATRTCCFTRGQGDLLTLNIRCRFVTCRRRVYAAGGTGGIHSPGERRA